jgi:hypothetical protein
MSDEFLTVATFATVPEAEAARLMFESEGIPAILTDAEIVNMDWLLGTAVGYVKVQVPPSKAEAASALLERIEAERRRRRAEAADPEDDAWPLSDDLACLACGTEMPEDEHRCPTCGWSYADGRE